MSWTVDNPHKNCITHICSNGSGTFHWHFSYLADYDVRCSFCEERVPIMIKMWGKFKMNNL